MKAAKWILTCVMITVVVAATFASLNHDGVRAQGDEESQLVVFASNRNQDNYDIFVLDTETGLTTQLTTDPGDDVDPVWSPDGSRIAFASEMDGDFDLYVMRADGTDPRQLTNNTAEDRFPRWQPDGEFLVFVSDMNGQHDLYLVAADGATIRQLTNDVADERGPGFGEGGTLEPGGPTTAPGAPTATPLPAQPDATVASFEINIRENPGEGADILTVEPRDTPLDIIGRRFDDTWVQVVTPAGITGWAFTRLLEINTDLTTVPVVNAPFIPPPPTATPIPPTATPGQVTISFWSDKTSISAGQCAVLSWFVENIKEVYYQNQGVTGSGSRTECPTATTTYNLRVIRRDNVVDNRYITITVTP